MWNYISSRITKNKIIIAVERHLVWQPNGVFNRNVLAMTRWAPGTVMCFYKLDERGRSEDLSYFIFRLITFVKLATYS